MILSTRDRPFDGFQSINDAFHNIGLNWYADPNRNPDFIRFRFYTYQACEPLTVDWEYALFMRWSRCSIYVDYDPYGILDIFFLSFGIILDEEGNYVPVQERVRFPKIAETLEILFKTLKPRSLQEL
jgi:hypothetical protein